MNPQLWQNVTELYTMSVSGFRYCTIIVEDLNTGVSGIKDTQDISTIFVVCAKSLQSCPTLCNPMDYSLPGCSVHGILQARILERAAMPFSRGIFPTQGSNLHLQHWQVSSLPLAPPRKPILSLNFLPIYNYFKIDFKIKYKTAGPDSFIGKL